MTVYCDSSLIVALLANESDGEAARAWLEAHAEQGLLVSNWTGAEVASAFAMKQRRGDIDAFVRNRLWCVWLDFALNSADFAHVDRDDFERATGLVDAGDGLRAGDALHLAVALNRKVALATRDRAMATAAEARGVQTHRVGAIAD